MSILDKLDDLEGDLTKLLASNEALVEKDKEQSAKLTELSAQKHRSDLALIAAQRELGDVRASLSILRDNWSANMGPEIVKERQLLLKIRNLVEMMMATPAASNGTLYESLILKSATLDGVRVLLDELIPTRKVTVGEKESAGAG